MSSAFFVFPAHAGMSLQMVRDAATLKGFPRSRGDEPTPIASVICVKKFSPLTRG